jgi:nicotinamidase/pyrazinamidase
MPRFVIVVDAQHDFMLPDGALYVGAADSLIAPIGDWLSALDPADTAGVLLTFDTHDRDTYPASAEAAQFPIHCVRGEPGWQSVIATDRIDPTIPVYALEKGVFDMWAEPGVPLQRVGTAETHDRDAFFAALQGSGIDEVEVVGVAADYCVRWAVEGLIARGFRVTLPVALTRGIARQIDGVLADEWSGRPVTLREEV